MEVSKQDSSLNKEKPTKEFCKVKLILEGGISQELVTDNHRNICAELICSICLEIVRYPKLCKSCQHMFCTDCLARQLSKSKFCPNRCLFKEQDVNLIFKKILHKIELKCYYWKGGCEDIVLYENFDKHIENCVWGDYKCLSPGCSFIGNLRDIKIHVAECLLKILLCECCKCQITKGDYNVHYTECSNKKVECEYCKQLITNKDFIKHKDICDEFDIKCSSCEQIYKRKDLCNHNEIICLKNQVNFWKSKYEKSESEKMELSQRLKISNSSYMEKFLSSVPSNVQSQSSIQYNNPNLIRFLNNQHNHGVDIDSDFNYDNSINLETNQQNVIHDMEYL